jgi:hypothetical protein
MSFETLRCSNCGSDNVQEVKPNTYFCNHCDAVSKYVDPARLTVGPAFCEHGNRIEVQCQVCRTGMCRSQCDIVPAWLEGHAGIVRTQGFGYLETGQGKYVSVDGPFLSVGELLTSLSLDRGETLSHACRACVIRAVPAAAAHISAGAICETKGCSGTPAGTCPCCQGSFCRMCSMPLIVKHSIWKDGVISLDHGMIIKSAAICPWDPEVDRESESIPVDMPTPDGMCGPCVGENRDKAAAMAATICRQDYAGKLIPIGGDMYFHERFKVPAARVGRKNAYLERARVQRIARGYAAEINARLQQLAPTAGACDRGRLGRRSKAGIVPYAGYVIVDERDRVKPSAVSGVIVRETIRPDWMPAR